MSRGIKAFLIIAGGLLLFTALIELKIYLSNKYFNESLKKTMRVGNISSIIADIKTDSLYEVKEVIYKDSAILISVSNPEKSGTDEYFNKKYNLNGFSNINMVYIYQFDSAKPLGTASPDDAIMATGKKLGRFQEQWTNRYIDTTDKACKPLKKYLQAKLLYPESFKNEETIFQPESINSMQVICKYRIKDSSGTTVLREITAVIDTGGRIISTK